MNTQAATETDETVRPYMARWGAALNEGYVAVPRVLLRHQHDLGITSEEVVLLLNLLSSWWTEDDHPYPAVSTLAHRIGTTTRTVQRNLRSLEAKGFIKRLRNQAGNGAAADRMVTRYVLAGTVQKLIAAVNLPTSPLPSRPALPSKYNAGRTVRPSPTEVFSGLEA